MIPFRTAARPLVLLAFGVAVLCASSAPAQEASSDTFTAADAAIQQAIADREIPGAVLVVGHGGKALHRKAFGLRAMQLRTEPMTPDTIFDLASLTKPFTALCVMRLVERGQVRLSDSVARYIPEFARNGKQDITVRQLLTHFSGLPADLELQPPWSGYTQALQLAYDVQAVIPPGSGFIYSDINYIVLGELVARVSGMSLDRYATEHIFSPLKMDTTRFNPPAEWRARIAPTAYDEHGIMLRGVVDDPSARRMGGIAGHAGLFSTADDLARFAQALLDRDSSLLSAAAIEKMTTPQQPAYSTVLRGLGWDIDSPFSTNRGELLPVGSFGHSGFTGTSIWIDPVTQTYIILLSNAIHPNGTNNQIVSLRTRVANAVAAGLNLLVSGKDEQRWAAITGYNETLAGARRLQDRDGTVLTGIDVLESRGFDLLRQGRSTTLRVGLVTNQTGVDSQGRRTIDMLAHAPGISLVAIFSPEHGAAGTLDTTEIGNTRDTATGVPIYSVYGATSAQRRPPLDVLRKLDAVVIDLQDAGAPFFSYEVTMAYFLEAAAQTGIEVFVLDRPNPITGSFVQGPLVTHEPGNFKGYFPLPVRHGMTMGELAELFNDERAIRARLTVVTMRGWLRGDWYDATGLAWINPSPNLRSVNEATLYPGVALIEGTNISVGRGTDTPFEVVGAPWINARQFADYLNRRQIAGVRFVPVRFTPVSGLYANQLCGGANILVTRRNGLDSPELGVELAAALLKLYPRDFKIDRMNDILGNQAVFKAIVAGEDPRRIAEDWREPLEKFQQFREKYLLYLLH